MPIAHCIVTENYLEAYDRSCNLIELWAIESTKSSEHMTVNIISNTEQQGKKYGIMANLLIPTIWQGEDISLLQLGLAKALSSYFKASLSDVQVITTQVNSGMVVENGKEQQW